MPRRNDKVGGARAAHRYILVGLLVAAAAGYFLDREGLDEEQPAGSATAAKSAMDPQAPSPVRASAASNSAAPAAVHATAEHQRQLALTLESTLMSGDVGQRETAFAFILPELLVEAPGQVVEVLERSARGDARDALRDEVARQWIKRDREATVAWIHSLPDEVDRQACATMAVRSLAASSPARAVEVADEFDVGRDDGSLEHLVQIWATENPEEALRWVQAQPDGPGVAQLRSRIEHVLAQRGAGP